MRKHKVGFSVSLVAGMAALLFGNSVANAMPITLANADFEGGVIGNDPVSWTMTEPNHVAAFYATVDSGLLGNDVVLSMQGRGNGNIAEQSFLTSEATADSFGTFNVTVDLGWRSDDGSARTVGIEIWNVTDGVSLASDSYIFPPDGINDTYRVTETAKTFVLTYDNTAAGLVGDTIALRILNDSTANTFATTTWIDNVSVEAIVPEPTSTLFAILGMFGLFGACHRRVRNRR